MPKLGALLPHYGTGRLGSNIQLLIELLAERFRVRRPASIARRNQIGDHPANITLLRGVVVRARMVAGDSHGPGLMPGVETRKEGRRIFDILARVEHFRRRRELVAVEMVVDLHAAEVDQLGAACPRRLEGLQRLLLVPAEIGLALDIHGIGLQRSLPAGLGETDGIEDAGRDIVFRRRREDFTLAAARRRRFRGRRRQSAQAGRQRG